MFSYNREEKRSPRSRTLALKLPLSQPSNTTMKIELQFLELCREYSAEKTKFMIVAIPSAVNIGSTDDATAPHLAVAHDPEPYEVATVLL